MLPQAQRTPLLTEAVQLSKTWVALAVHCVSWIPPSQTQGASICVSDRTWYLMLVSILFSWPWLPT